MIRQDSPSSASPHSGPTALIACGGTGGHLFPGLALADALAGENIGTLLAISSKAVDHSVAASRPDLRFETLAVRPWPGVRPAAAPFFFRFASTWLRVSRLLRRESIAAVIGMGGFTSLIPVWVGRRRGLPTFLHDSNAIPGRANRITARHTDTVFLGMEAAVAHFPGSRTRVVGTPVRPGLAASLDAAAARASLGLAPDKPVLLVIGGSQGAASLNRAALHLATSGPRPWQILLLTGEADGETMRRAANHPDAPLVALPFCHDMATAYAASSLVLARAGASTLAELSLVGLPALLVPYPHAADDHQTANARAFVNQGAARLIPDAKLSAETLAQAIADWAPGSPGLDTAAAAMRSLAHPDAASAMATTIAETMARKNT